MDLYNLAAQIRESFTNFISSGSLYLSDVLDVILVAILIYAILLLLRRTRSYLILFGVFILGVIYVAAKSLNLYLTSVALQSLFSVLFIVIIVVFQAEIRRFFELIALFSTRQIKISPNTNVNTHISEMVQAVANMSHDRIGALIVLPGEDDLDRFLEGGVLADSVISEELITSLFDPHSPGHDGAMIISKNRLRNFGTHLPLSINFKEIGKHGTRHSAALGISEQTDCLAIVVSEESGSISIAREGKLKKLTGAEELNSHVTKFLKSNSRNLGLSWKQIISRDFALKGLSISLALLLWITFAFRAETIRKEYLVPVSFTNLPQGVLVEEYSPKDVKVTLEGRGESSFTELNPASLKVNVNAESLENGLNTVKINSQDISRPLKLSAYSVNPDSVYISAKKYRLILLPIKIQTIGEPFRNFKVSNQTADPSELEVWIPEQEVSPDALLVQPISISSAKQNILGEYELIIPGNIKLKKQEDKTINVAISIEPK